MASNPPTIPSFSGFFQTLWNDFLQFLAILTGRTFVAPRSASTGPQIVRTPPAFQSPQGSGPILVSPNIPLPYSAPTLVAPKAAVQTLSLADAVRKAVATETNINPRDLNGYLSTSPAALVNWNTSIIVNRAIYFNPGDCGGQGTSNLSLGEAAAGYGLKGAVLGETIAHVAASSVLGLATMGIGVALGVVEVILNHHASAVARDTAAECSLNPGANNVLKVVIDGVLAGQLSPAQGIAALQALPPKYLQAAGPAKNNHPYCNSICEYLIVLRAICFYWISQFEAMQ